MLPPAEVGVSADNLLPRLHVTRRITVEQRSGAEAQRQPRAVDVVRERQRVFETIEADACGEVAARAGPRVRQRQRRARASHGSGRGRFNTNATRGISGGRMSSACRSGGAGGHGGPKVARHSRGGPKVARHSRGGPEVRQIEAVDRVDAELAPSGVHHERPPHHL